MRNRKSCTSLTKVSSHTHLVSLSCKWDWIWWIPQCFSCSTPVLPTSQLVSLLLCKVLGFWQHVPSLLYFILSQWGVRMQINSQIQILLPSSSGGLIHRWLISVEKFEVTASDLDLRVILLKNRGAVHLCGIHICDTKRISPIICHLGLHRHGFSPSKMLNSPSKKNCFTRSLHLKAFVKGFILKPERTIVLWPLMLKGIHKVD